MKRILLLGMFFVTYVSPSYAEQLIYIKYRSDPVDVDKPYFESLDTSKSSFIRRSWFDEKNHYLILDLEGTNYHYCNVPSGIWNAFKHAQSFGSFYNALIRGRFDCRLHKAPQY